MPLLDFFSIYVSIKNLYYKEILMESFINTLLASFFVVLKKYSDFNGRAARREFWMFMLCNLLVGVILSIFGFIPFIGRLFKLVSILYALAVLVPSLAVGARRLHDTGKTALLLLLLLIPGVGTIIVLALCLPEGVPGANEYGPDPLDET